MSKDVKLLEKFQVHPDEVSGDALAISLSLMEEGDEAYILKIRCAGNISSRLIGLGIHPGVKIKVVRKGRGSSPMIIDADYTRIGLGRSICRDILVTADAGLALSPNLR